MQSKWMKRLLPLAVLALALAIVLLMLRSRPDLPRREAVASVPLVEVMTAEPGPVAVTVKSRGTVTARIDIQLTSEVSGQVKWVAPAFVTGGAVSKGTPLLRIDPLDYEVALSAARAAVASAELSLAEVEVVVKRAAIDEAKAQLKASRDRLREAEDDLANTEIVAPFDAIIDTKQADLGQYVQAGSPLMRLLSSDSVEVRLPLLPSDLPYIRYGQANDGSWPQAVLSASFGDIEYNWPARLVRLEQRVDEQTRVFYLVAEVDSPYDPGRYPQPLSVGLFVQARIEGNTIPLATRIPRSALYDGDAVFLLQEGRLRKHPVTVLRREQDSVIVGDGLSAGDQVVLSRLDLMVEGMSVAVEQ